MRYTLADWIPPAADGVAALALWLLFGGLSQRLGVPSLGSAWLLIAFYIIFCFGVNGIRKLLPASYVTPPPWLEFLQTRPWRVAQALSAILAFLMAQADLNKLVESTLLLAENPGKVNEGEVSLYFAFGPAFLWTIIGFFYLLVLITPVTPRVGQETPRGAVTAFASLLAVNFMVLTAAAYAAAVGARSGDGAILALLSVWLLLIFIPPRLMHYWKRPNRWALLSYGLFLGLVLGRMWLG